MPSIAATAYPVPAYVLVQANWTGLPATYAKVVRRNTVTGEEVDLRPYSLFDGNGNLALSCSLGLWWDTEPPLNVPLEYCTYAADIPTFANANPGFETGPGTAPWVGSGGVLTQSAVFAHEGTFSGLMTPDGTSFGNVVAQTVALPVAAGAPVVLQGWVFSPQGHNAVVVSGTFIDADTGISSTISTGFYTLFPNQWQLLKTTFTPTNAGTITSIRASSQGIASAGTLFYWDEVGVLPLTPIPDSACDTVTVVSESIWLKNPLSPCLDVEVGLCIPGMDFDCESDSRVSYAGMSNDDLAANTVLSEPANRKYPIPVSRQRRAPTSELRLIAHDCTARDAVLAINDPGTPLLFQAPADYCLPDRYISVGTETEARFSVDQREDFRVMGLPYAVVQRPEGPADGICGARILDLCDIYTSWQAIFLGGLTYEDLLLGLASYDGPVTSPPVEDMRIWSEVEAGFANWLAVEAAGARDWGELRDGL